MSTVAPSFSYAEAAKGKSPSLTAEAPAKSEDVAVKETMADLPPAQISTEVKEDTAKNEANVEDTQVEQKSSQREAPEMATDPQVSGTAAPGPSQTQTDLAEASEEALSGSTATVSVSAGAKEAEGTATPKESSDPGWEKVSQQSQTDDKQAAKEDWEGDDSKLSNWEHVSSQVGLKEAPPPAVNIWQKRAMDAQAKAKDNRNTQAANSANAPDPGSSQIKKSPDPRVDTARQDTRQKTRGGHSPAEDKAGSGDVRGNTKQGEGKPRNDEGNRVTSPANTSATSAPLPPSDPTSWPTPKLAEEDEKKKAHDRTERVEKERTPGKPQGKEKWEKIDFVPTAVFNTPLPTARRGGRGGARGARENSRGNYSGAAGERSTSGGGEHGGTPGATPPERSRGNMGPPRGGAANSRPKRSASAGPVTGRDQRGDGEPTSGKREDAGHRNFASGPRYPQNENRRSSQASTQTDVGLGLRQASPSRRSHASGYDRELGMGSGYYDFNHSRGAGDRRHDPSSKGQDFSRDQGFFTRERGDSRSERGRGGYRGGRGGHPSSAYTHAVNGPNGNQAQHGYAPAKSQSYTEQRQGLPSNSSAYGPPRDGRHHRSGSRSQSIPNPPPFPPRFPGNGSAMGPQPLANLQTDVANMYGYQTGQPAVMSAIPYHPYMESMQIQGMVQMQMEYYFSVDNLCKDMFLRKHMDSQGFVFLTVLQNFNRIKQLTQDFETIRFICARSLDIELVVGPDGLDRVRKAQDWQQWVLSMEERDPTARNDGPTQVRPPNVFPPYGGPDYMQAPPANTPLSPQGSSRGAQRKPEPILVNGNGSSTPVADSKITQTPLTAAAPDFNPSLPQPLPAFQPPEVNQDLENSFSDEQVESLVIVVRKQNKGGNASQVTEAASRSQSPNAQAADASAAESKVRAGGDRSSPVIVNGDRSTESNGQLAPPRAFSPFTIGGFPRPQPQHSMPMFWVKDKDQPTENLPHDLTHESYTAFRASALQQRAQSPPGQCHHDMDILYQFWSHFLVRNFNARMYAEFRQHAFDDARQRQSPTGLRNLVAFYYESILANRVVSDGLARDFVDLVASEKGQKERPAFDKLRAAWRNGAFNLKNRKKIDNIVDPELKTELEK